MAFSSAALRHTLAGFQQSNIAPSDLLHGLVDEAVLGQDFWLCDADYQEIIRRAVELSDNPAIGLSVGLRDDNCLAVGAARLHVSLVRSFSHAVQSIVRFQTLVRDHQHVFATLDRHTVTMKFGPDEGPLPVRRFLAETAVASMRSLLARFAGSDARPLRASFDYPAPTHSDEYRKALGCEVTFQAECSELVVQRELADRQQLLFQPELAEHLAEQAEWHLAQTQRAGIAANVRWLLHPSASSDVARMSEVARRLGLSERSLRRKLSREGLHFKTILAEARCTLASRLLRSGMNIKQIASEVGYGSSSAFHRAFVRWSGVSPAVFAAVR